MASAEPTFVQADGASHHPVQPRHRPPVPAVLQRGTTDFEQRLCVMPVNARAEPGKALAHEVVHALLGRISREELGMSEGHVVSSRSLMYADTANEGEVSPALAVAINQAAK